MKTESQIEYERLLHAMQTGVMYELEYALKRRNITLDEEVKRLIKHLRVGNNARAREHGSLVKLLIDKGIITDDEYSDAMLEGMREEVKMYEKMLTQEMGAEVNLG